MRWALLLMTIFGLTLGCRTVPDRPQAAPAAEQQLSEAFRVALTFVKQSHRVVLVVLPRAMDDRTRRAIRAVCDTVDRKDVPETVGYSLPDGYFLVEYAVVDGSVARVTGVLGPVPKPRPGFVMLGCGTGYYIDLTVDGATWKITKVLYREC